MTESDSPTPEDGRWHRNRRVGRVSMLFLGKGYPGSRAEAFEAFTGEKTDVAWAKQIHGADVLDGRYGRCGDGDALVTREPGLPLSVATADCVPVLLYTEDRVAAVHAGWRGLVAGVIGQTVARLGNADELGAWIGPSIGSCCYEVSTEVADEVAATCAANIRRPGRAERPHIDLIDTARQQLEAVGVRSIDVVDLCTHCAAESLWSYRREGPKAGRNTAYVWLESEFDVEA